MAEHVLTNAVVVSDGLDVTGQLNQLEGTYSQDLLDSTVFGSSARSRTPGLSDFSGSLTGFYVSDEDTTSAVNIPFDQESFNRIDLGTTSGTLAFGPDSFTTGSVLYFVDSVQSEYTFGGTVGDFLTANLTFSGNGTRAVRGQSALYSTSTTGSVNGPGVSLGAVTSTQRLYAYRALLRTTGTGTTVKVTSSTDVTDFTLETTRLTFSALSTRGADIASIAGPITDTAFRISVTTTAAVDVDILSIFGVE